MRPLAGYPPVARQFLDGLGESAAYAADGDRNGLVALTGFQAFPCGGMEIVRAA